jgi:hypothetical protein
MLVEEASSMLEKLEEDVHSFELEQLLSGKYDKCDCMMCIQVGAGGNEAQVTI